MQQPFITLNLNNITLSLYKSVKYLGIYIDEQLNFKCYIDCIEQKISRAVGILAKLSRFTYTGYSKIILRLGTLSLIYNMV